MAGASKAALMSLAVAAMAIVAACADTHSSSRPPERGDGAVPSLTVDQSIRQWNARQTREGPRTAADGTRPVYVAPGTFGRSGNAGGPSNPGGPGYAGAPGLPSIPMRPDATTIPTPGYTTFPLPGGTTIPTPADPLSPNPVTTTVPTPGTSGFPR